MDTWQDHRWQAVCQRFTYIGLINRSGIYKNEILKKKNKHFLMPGWISEAAFLGPEAALACLPTVDQGLWIRAGPGPKGGRPMHLCTVHRSKDCSASAQGSFP